MNITSGVHGILILISKSLKKSVSLYILYFKATKRRQKLAGPMITDDHSLDSWTLKSQRKRVEQKYKELQKLAGASEKKRRKSPF